MKDYKRLTDTEIAEMAKAMGDFELKDTVKCDIELSEHLFAKGYRKQSDTVKEFVERVKEVYDKYYLCPGGFEAFDLWLTVVYLAEEYGVEVEK